jgi:hypothetical protein
MARAPYRAPSDTPPARQETGDSQLLGVHRLTCTPPPLARALAPACGLFLMLLAMGALLAVNSGPGVFAAVVPFSVLGFLMLGWSPLRRRRLRVDLHAHGVAVSHGSRREVVPFEDVDEVWMILDSRKTSMREIALVSALRLVLHDGSSRRVPTDIPGGSQIARAVILHCSHPLRAQAAEALKAGETLTFGSLKLDRTWLRGPRWAVRWSDVSLVRFMPGRMSIFRRQRFIPWRTIGLDRVPHPTVFIELSKRCASKVELDDCLLALTN